MTHPLSCWECCPHMALGSLQSRRETLLGLSSDQAPSHWSVGPLRLSCLLQCRLAEASGPVQFLRSTEVWLLRSPVTSEPELSLPTLFFPLCGSCVPKSNCLTPAFFSSISLKVKFPENQPTRNIHTNMDSLDFYTTL